MPTIYVPRVFGGTLIIVTTPKQLKAAFSSQDTLKMSFASQSKYKVQLFASQSKYNAKFSEAAMVLPNSTVQSSATVTDASNNPQTSLTGTVTVSFPDGTSSAPLTPTNAGAGVYTLTYTSKGPGFHVELWSFVDGSGNALTDKNILVCAY